MAPTILVTNNDNLRTPIVSYLKGEVLPQPIMEKIRRRATRYMLIEGELAFIRNPLDFHILNV